MLGFVVNLSIVYLNLADCLRLYAPIALDLDIHNFVDAGTIQMEKDTAYFKT